MLIGHTVSDSAGRMIAIDHDASEILQRSEREVLGISYANFTHSEDQERNIALIARLTAQDRPLVLKKRYVRPDHSAVWCKVHASRMGSHADGMLIGTLQLAHVADSGHGPEGLWRSARQLEAHLRRCRAELGQDLFADPAWAILLQIYLAEAEGRVVNAEAIAALVDLRPTLVHRWLDVLAHKGIVDRPESTMSAGQLTGSGITKIENLLRWHLGNQEAARA